MFDLLKWYLDVVTSDGAVVILYAARLRWARLVLRYASLLVDDAGGQRTERATTGRIEAPHSLHGEISWQNIDLDVQGQWCSDVPPIQEALLSTRSGDIRWACRMPRGHATVRCGQTIYDGMGYAESLRLTIPPWKLPIRTLHWGRYTSASHSLVWIDWEGPEHRRWTWLDGQPQPLATLTESGVAGLDSQGELRFADGRDIRDRRVLRAVGAVLPAPLRRAAGPLAGMHERKRVSRAAFVCRGRPVEVGWALHEVVTW